MSSKKSRDIWVFVRAFLILQGHQPRMPDYVKLFLRDAKEHRFEINFLLKSIDWRFLYQNFINLCQIVCLLHGFEVTANFSPQNRFPIAIQWQYIFELLSFLNDLSYRYEIGLDLKIIWCSFRKLLKKIILLSKFNYIDQLKMILNKKLFNYSYFLSILFQWKDH